MKSRTLAKWMTIAALVSLGTCACGDDNPFPWPWVDPDVLPSYRDICITMANGARLDDSGVTTGRSCDPEAYLQYWVGFGGSGLKEVHIAQNTADPDGDVVEGAATSGTFYVTNRSKNKGYTGEAILLVSVKTADPLELGLDFSVSLKASGYQIVTNDSQEVTDRTYVQNALDDVFSVSDLIYGPQSWKPAGTDDYPLWYGEDVSDDSTKSLLMFVDLNTGILNGTDIFAGLTDNGAVKVEYSITGLTHELAFNAFGYTVHANQPQGINWTNLTDTTDANGITVSP